MTYQQVSLTLYPGNDEMANKVKELDSILEKYEQVLKEWKEKRQEIRQYVIDEKGKEAFSKMEQIREKSLII